jgi:hypothetical protein
LAMRSMRPGSPARSWVTNSSSTATAPEAPMTGTASASRTPARCAWLARSNRSGSRTSGSSCGWPVAHASPGRPSPRA